MRLMRDPVPYVEAAPLPSNILEWHYVVKGPEDTPYYGGYYHGKLQFPKDYPFKPPRIIMITPNGRFQINTRLCLSISDFHPDTWNPAWSVATILTGLLSFMVEKTATLGSIETPLETRKSLAIASWAFNLKDSTFCQLFPSMCEEIKERQRDYLSNSAKSEQELQNLVPSTDHTHNFPPEPSFCNSFLGNVALFTVVIAFVWFVQFLVKTAS